LSHYLIILLSNIEKQDPTTVFAIILSRRFKRPRTSLKRKNHVQENSSPYLKSIDQLYPLYTMGLKPTTE